MKYVTRIAPSPTGMFHLGTARTAYFNWLAAKASGGRMILRIDDTDMKRNDPAAIKVIYDAMDWLGLDDYTLVSSQSANLLYYRDIAAALVEHDLAYVEDGAYWLKARDYPNYWTDDRAGPVKITKNDNDLINRLVLIRSDGIATYNFATVIDDIRTGVNYIIRGTDHTANTAKQVAIRSAIAILMLRTRGIDEWLHGHINPWIMHPKYAHVGLITMNKKKLSKRDAAVSLLDYRDKGIHPDAMLNFMLRLGWSPSDPNFDKKHSLITRDMAIDMFFKDGSMRNSPAGMDLLKLDWYDRRYKALNPAE